MIGTVVILDWHVKYVGVGKKRFQTQTNVKYSISICICNFFCCQKLIARNKLFDQ